MNVQVEAFNCEYRFLVQPHVTIGRLFDRLAGDLSLAPPNRRRLFGLQVFNERLQTVVWPSPTETLAQGIEGGMKYKPLAVRFYLRAHTFPKSIEDLRGDRSALELLYRQVQLEQLLPTGGKGSQKFRALETSALEITLLALSMVVDCGAFVVASSVISTAELLKVVGDRVVSLGGPSSGGGGGGRGDNQVGQAVLKMWRFLGLMTAAEAQFNYLNLLAGSENYSLEKVRFSVQQQQQQQQKIRSDGKEKKKKEQVKVQLAVFYEGIEVVMKVLVSGDDDAENGNSSELLPLETSTTTTTTKMDWSVIRSIKQRKNLLTIKFHKGEAGNAEKPPKASTFTASSSFEAHLIYELIIAYHGEHLRRLGLNEGYPSARGISTEARFILPQAEFFFGRILAQMVALDCCIKELKKSSRSVVLGEKMAIKEEKIVDVVEVEEENSQVAPEEEKEKMSLIEKNYSGSEFSEFEEFADNEKKTVEAAEIVAEQENSTEQQEKVEEEIKTNEDKEGDENALIASEPSPETTSEFKVEEVKDSPQSKDDSVQLPSTPVSNMLTEEKMTTASSPAFSSSINSSTPASSSSSISGVSKRGSLSSSSSQSGDDLLSDHSADLSVSKLQLLPRPHFIFKPLPSGHAQQGTVPKNEGLNETVWSSDNEIISEGFDFEGNEEGEEEVKQISETALNAEVSSPFSYPDSFSFSSTTEEVSTGSSKGRRKQR